jgi:nucleoside-diphosphate-sugar epimerase
MTGVLVTGAAGVLGSAVVEALDGHDVTRLTHRGSAAAPDPGAVPGSVGETRLGLDARGYRELCARIDCVVHCAAASDYSVGQADMEAINVGGTAHVLELCAEAGAHLYHVGTALEAERDDEDAPPSAGGTAVGRRSPFSRAPYLATKRAAERLVRDSGLPATLLRPSLIIGDRTTGRTPRFQGIHTLMRFILTETYGVVPAVAGDRADYLPRDTIAGAIACLVSAGRTPDLCWLTAGDRAPTMQRIVDLAMAYGHAVGLDPPQPRFMDPEVIERLVRPALLPELPHRERQRFEYVIEFASGLHSGRIFPSDLAAISGDSAIPTAEGLEDALSLSLQYWGTQTNIAGTSAGGERGGLDVPQPSAR